MTAEHADVVVVGAGLSGVGAAARLASTMPHLRVVVLEGRQQMGGTWDLFRYPGVRSDSDMHTLGYGFEPWTGPQAIADGTSIRRYIESTAARYGVTERIRFRHWVVAADWCSAQARWTVQVDHHTAQDRPPERVTLTCAFLYLCTGYYRYDEGYTPALPGLGDFAGPVVHPQHWPADLDHRGSRVVVIGSGATAVTLVPALARDAAHVVMLQRSPSYVLPRPSRDAFAAAAQRVLPQRPAHALARWKNLLAGQALYRLSRSRPAMVRRFIRSSQQPLLPPGYDLDTHLRPRDEPWDQRLCLAADGDLFDAIRQGRASIVTDSIERVVEHGVRLASGRVLEADLLVTATGLCLLALGGIALRVDGVEVDVADTVLYRGVMLSGVPNLAYTVGYTNASWTLKADLVSAYVCRLLRYMRRHRVVAVVAVPPEPSMLRVPAIDLQAGYVRRSLHELPQQGTRPPWRLHQNYVRDLLMLRHGRIADGVLRFATADDLRDRRQPMAADRP